MSNLMTEDDIFEVEKIIESRLDKDGLCHLFRVRWKGCKSDEDTWEPLENLLSCNELLKQFNKKRRKKKSPKKKLNVTMDSSTQFVLSKIKEEPKYDVETAQIYMKLQNNAKNPEEATIGSLSDQKKVVLSLNTDINPAGFTKNHQLQMEVASEESKKLSTAFSEDSVISNTLKNVTSKTENERVSKILDDSSDNSLKSQKCRNSTNSLENIISYPSSITLSSSSNIYISLVDLLQKKSRNNSTNKSTVLETIVPLKERLNSEANNINKQNDVTTENEDIIMEESIYKEYSDENLLRHGLADCSVEKIMPIPPHHAVASGKLDSAAAVLEYKVNFDSKKSMEKLALNLANENSTPDGLCSADPIKKDIVTHHCKNTFKYEMNLKNYTAEKPFKCTYCEYKTGKKCDLTRHLQIHTGEKPFKCIYCNYKCSQKHTLKVHLTTHTGEKPFKCTYCDYKTGRKSDLTIHTRIHTGEKPYKCIYCDYKFSQKHTLKVHLTTHTGEKPFKCTYCNYATGNQGCLTKHIKNSHTYKKTI